MKRLEEKAVIVTGAGAGIGEAITHKFAREGAHVLVSGRPGDPVEEVAAAIREHYACQTPEPPATHTPRRCRRLGSRLRRPVGVFVNNAGTVPATGEAQDYPVEAFDKLIHNNIRSTLMMTRTALPKLQKTRGTIVSAGSEAGLNGTPMSTPCGGTKEFMHGFIKGVAVEQVKHGVRANCVCPGPVDTDTRPAYGAMDEPTAQLVTGALFSADGGVTVACGNVGEQVPGELRHKPRGELKPLQQLAGSVSKKPTG